MPPERDDLHRETIERMRALADHLERYEDDEGEFDFSALAAVLWDDFDTDLIASLHVALYHLSESVSREEERQRANPHERIAPKSAISDEETEAIRRRGALRLIESRRYEEGDER